MVLTREYLLYRFRCDRFQSFSRSLLLVPVVNHRAFSATTRVPGECFDLDHLAVGRNLPHLRTQLLSIHLGDARDVPLIRCAERHRLAGRLAIHRHRCITPIQLRLDNERTLLSAGEGNVVRDGASCTRRSNDHGNRSTILDGSPGPHSGRHAVRLQTCLAHTGQANSKGDELHGP